MSGTWAIFAFYEDASSEAWGPFRSRDKASAVFDQLQACTPGDVLCLERLAPPPSRADLALRHAELPGDLAWDEDEEQWVPQ